MELIGVNSVCLFCCLFFSFFHFILSLLSFVYFFHLLFIYRVLSFFCSFFFLSFFLLFFLNNSFSSFISMTILLYLYCYNPQYKVNQKSKIYTKNALLMCGQSEIDPCQKKHCFVFSCHIKNNNPPKLTPNKSPKLLIRYKRRKEMFYLMTHSTHFIYSYMALDIWLRTILIVREETCCRHIGYSF